MGRVILLFVLLIVGLAVFVYLTEPAFPGAPAINRTHIPQITPTPQELGSYDVLGQRVSRSEAEGLRSSIEGRTFLSPDNGALEITPDLLHLGRRVFYEETFGNEVVVSNVVGVLDGPFNLWTMSRAILGLRGGYTDNLQIRINNDVTVGGRLFAAGTVFDTGLDVPAGWLVPLGMRMSIVGGRPRVGITCALCHSTVDPQTGVILEGAPNSNLNMGLLMAMGSNSAVFFRNTGVNPLDLPRTGRSISLSDGSVVRLPDIRALEEAVDRDLLSWPPGSFDSTADLVNNPSQIPTSYTFETWPYGWNGFASAGWFQGLSTLNNNVHALNSDPTTGFENADTLWGIDPEVYLGIIFQNSANDSFRLPDGGNPRSFLASINPTPIGSALNSASPMPGYPAGNVFITDGLMLNLEGSLFSLELNSMSAFQHSLAPPPSAPADLETLQRGADVFMRAGCAECHSGRYFTNNLVIPWEEVRTQPSRAAALGGFIDIFLPPNTYSPTARVPVQEGTPVLEVPLTEIQEANLGIAYQQTNPTGGYKVQNLIGLHVSAPYLHDGGVAASATALRQEADRWVVVNQGEMGLAGTLYRGVLPDPANSLRVLVDRNLREAAVAANRAHPAIRNSNSDGNGHDFYADLEAGFTLQEQNDLVFFLLSIDDNPAVIPGVTAAQP